MSFFKAPFEFIDEHVGFGKEIVALQAEMEPLIISTMTKFKAEVLKCNVCGHEHGWGC